jgi:hypothetical protein
LEYIAEPIVTAVGAANHVKFNQLDDNLVLEVLAINEFSDVFFLKELSVMPPNRDIEFVTVYLKLHLCIRDHIGWLLSN